MRNIEGIIFDMDGTLYPFDRGKTSSFTHSKFGQQINENAICFFIDRFHLPREEALLKYLDIKTRFNGEVSIGLEKEHGIPRAEYFAATWNLDTSELIEQQPNLPETLRGISIRKGVLSAAPRIWIDKVLNFLQVQEFFENVIFSGDPDLRKPDPLAFQQVADRWDLDPTALVSIGDQEETDILPAKTLHMTTVRIGTNVETQADFLAENVEVAIALLKEKGII